MEVLTLFSFRECYESPQGIRNRCNYKKLQLGCVCPLPSELNSPENKGSSAPKDLVGVESAFQHCQTTA